MKGQVFHQIRVLIAEGHPHMRAALRRLLAVEPDIIVVGEVANGSDALIQAVRLLPDVALVDTVMLDPDGVEIVRRLRAEAPSVHILVMTYDPDACLTEQASAAGADGCIVKGTAVAELAAAIRIIADGGTYLPGQRGGGQA